VNGLEQLAQALGVTTEEAARRLAGLDERERELIEYRLGFDQDGERRTLEETGEAFDFTRERVRQIEYRAIARLRHPNFPPILPID